MRLKNIFFSPLSHTRIHTRLISLLRLIEFSFDLRKLPQYARVLAVSRSYTISFSFSFSVFHCVESCFFFVSPERGLYRQGITAQRYLEKLSSFHQANSESNATPYNSIRRRRKKCEWEKVWGKGAVVWSIGAKKNKKKKKSTQFNYRWSLYSSYLCVSLISLLRNFVKTIYKHASYFSSNIASNAAI